MVSSGSIPPTMGKNTFHYIKAPSNTALDTSRDGALNFSGQHIPVFHHSHSKDDFRLILFL